MRYGAKRSLEELVNKSDSDDEDWSAGEHRPASRRGGRKSKKTPKKRARPAKKRRGNSGDIVSDDDEFATDDDLSIEESSEEEEDPNVPRNARGTARRRTTQNRPLYEEPDSDEETTPNDEDEELPEEPSPKKRKTSIVKLKVNPEFLARPELFTTRRTTRHNRLPSEDIYALTNSGRHMQTIQRGTTPAQKSPSPELLRRRPRTISRATEEPPAEIQASLEVLESDAPAEGDTVITQSITQEQVDVKMTIEEGVVPESENGEDEDDEDGPTLRRPSRPNRAVPDDDADFEPEEAPKEPQTSRKKPAKSSQRKNDEESDFEPEEEDSNDDDEDSEDGKPAGSPQKDEREASTFSGRPGLRARASRSRGQSEMAEELAEELDELRDGSRSRKRREPAVSEVYQKRPRRAAENVDYRLLRPEIFKATEDGDEEQSEMAVGSPSRRGRGGAGGGKWDRPLLPTMGPFGGGTERAVLGGSDHPVPAGGADSDSSDDETIPQTKNLGSTPSGLVGHKNDPQLAGTPANFGKLKDKQALADADPLGVDVTVNFDSVGGLQGHIDQLKEMVALPLLYPEIFQRFHIVPPRGVLFHGPPGTGKTLLARALANSVSSEGRKVSFYMRKGADALSKWVGEAERQLRLLFEEARKNQPSIIFFDEIDGKKSSLP